MLEQYAVADLLNWLDEKTLVINREYQRSAKIWPTPAKAYLIDTILRGYPIPKIYLRTRIHAPTRRAYREVVDGQQRLAAIRSYVNDEFPLGNSVEMYGEFAGLKYSQLAEARQTILAYPISVEQLMNVPDSEVINIFQRLNTYNYNLSDQELRHGKYQGAFKNAVTETSRRWEYLWSNYQILGNRARIRMADDELTGYCSVCGVALRRARPRRRRTNAASPNAASDTRAETAPISTGRSIPATLGHPATWIPQLEPSLPPP